jgi:hypothetical protein
MRNVTIGSDYTCLSHVWGQPDEAHPVLINGELRTVRKNLLDFLRRARKKQIGWLWVDALCIDQANVAERTHQVQQMGTIFFRATKVILWLGTSWKAVEFLREGSGSLASPEHATWFNQIEYWQRAWVTQEVILARQVTLMAADSEMSMDDLPGYVQRVGTNYVIRGRATNNRDDRAPFAPTLLPSDLESDYCLQMMSNLKKSGALNSWHNRGTIGSSVCAQLESLDLYF